MNDKKQNFPFTIPKIVCPLRSNPFNSCSCFLLVELIINVIIMTFECLFGAYQCYK